jgi:hypothetical protein
MLSARIGSWQGRRAVQVAIPLAGVALLGLILVGAFHKAYRPGGYDVHCFLATARAVHAGANPYLVDMPIPYNYPLLACTAAIPLTFLPEWCVHLGWFLASLAAWVCVAILLVRRLPRPPGIRTAWSLVVPLGIASMLLFGSIQNHLLNGQTDAFVLLLCVLFWIDWQEDRPQRGAFWLGLAVSLKLVPLLFFVPLIWRRSWRMLAGTCAWILLLSVALPAIFLGTGVFSAYEHYALTVLTPELYTAVVSERYPHNYTVHGALTWLVPAWKTSLAVRAGAALLVVLPLVAMEFRGDGGSPWRRLARLEAYLAGILLLAPLSQPHHLTLLLPAAWLLALRWLAHPDRSLQAELFDLAPFGLFPLWKILGGPLEFVAVAWLFVAAAGRATQPGRQGPALAERNPALKVG